ncbi:uncharacterized protein BP5553_08211 [Venustampulla echinocandica]|uniref:Biotrophy-associated secreted protein 2 n=1 Tax=Venustampulla echinocandica TaxID=2656787 RepID=A0A370TG28_9HELO|nr:uncharacterized protein BP5553_08211 [Venustampulla echinocandica]RDL33843.1 hypothetical protein BP5553_08211 [Venustampulla echinocandica]
MKGFTVFAILNLALAVYAVPQFNKDGAKNVGNGAGKQFITGQCLSNADCESTCCANPLGICSAPAAALQNGKTGCGFGSGGAGAANAGAANAGAAQAGSANTGAANAAATAAPAAAQGATGAAAASSNAAGGPPFNKDGAKNVGNGAGEQFITGQCLSNADCGSACCAGPAGICSAEAASLQNGKTGCGFVSTKRLVRM